MKKIKLKFKIAAFILVALITGSSAGQMVAKAAEIPYETYNYNYWGDIVITPAAYVPNGSVQASDLGIADFKEPQDFCYSDDGEVYVADTGNNRIVVLNSDMSAVNRVIDTFTNADGAQDTFSAPYGVCVSENNELYVADSNNGRVVVLTPQGEFIKIIENHQSEILDDNFAFVPLKVTVDYADRVYVIAKNAFEGILVFESNGEFTGFFGTIDVKITAWEKFWRRLASKEERSNQQLYIPTEFTGIDVDDGGFIYASNIDSDGIQAVRRLNPQGNDVIQKGENSNVGGDLEFGTYGDYAGASEITDVVYRDKGIYSLLDRKRGRIFTYDKEGNLLYIFGGLGLQEGTFQTPVAIEDIGEEIIVLDAGRDSILRFKETNYGSLINEAVSLRYDGDETDAISKWQEVLRLDENNELANSGIGKAYLTQGDNELAMKYLKLGKNRKYYSIAFKRYRNDVLASHMNYIMTGIILVILLVVLYKKFNVREKIKQKLQQKRICQKGGK